MSSSSARVLLGLVIALLAGCGGGGGGGGATFTVDPKSLSFTATQGDAPPATQTLHVHLNDTSLDYGSGWEGGDPAWIHEDTFATFPPGTIDYNHVYRITTTALTPGTYSGTLLLRTSEPGSYAIVEEKKVLVTYTVTSPP